MNANQLRIMEKIGELSKSIQKLQAYLARTDWKFTNAPRAYTGRYDDGTYDAFCYLETFEGKDMKTLFREQWQRFIDVRIAEIETLKKELASYENQSS